jgi:hypothetical protein
MKARVWPLLAAAAITCAFAAEPKGPPKPDKAGSARVTLLIRQLGDDEWRTRERATKTLRKVGEAALPALRSALKSADLEVRTRAEQLVEQIALDVAFSRMGNTLIADTYGGRVVEVDKTGQEIWALGDLREPVTASRMRGGKTLVAEREGGGKVSLVDRDGKELWSMKDLGTVWSASLLKNGNRLITCCGSELFSKGKVIEVDKDKKVVWEMKDLEAPRSSQRLPGGNTLIVERKAQRVIEVDKAGQVVWKVESLNAPLHAVRLPGGNTLISEWKPSRVIEVDAKGKVVWKYSQGLSGTSAAQRLANGHTLITDFGSNRVLQVDKAGRLIWNHDRLNSPCCAARMQASARPARASAPAPAGGVSAASVPPVIVGTLTGK